MESKFQIKERLFNTALEHWGFKDRRDIDDFDPLIELLVNTIASEVYNISSGIDDFEKRIIQKIISLLYHNTISDNCTHSIIHIQPVEPLQKINTFYQFKLPYESNSNEDINTDSIYFSPIGNIKLYDVEVKYMYYKNTMYYFKDNTKEVFEENVDLPSLQLNELELGISINNNIQHIDKLALFINLKSDYYQELFYSNLEYLEILINDKKTSFKKGMDFIFNKPTNLKEEISNHNSISYKIEQYVADYYKNYYIQLNNISLDKNNSKFSDYNKIIKDKNNVIWVKLKFPFNPDADFIQSFFSATNYIPVIQRKLIEETYGLNSDINIIPLSNNDNFQDIVSITNQDDIEYNSVEIEDFENLSAGKYFIRNNGILRINKTDIHKHIDLLLKLARNEYTSFRWLGMDTFSLELLKLKQSLSRLDTAYSTSEKPKKENYHCLIYPIDKNTDEIIYLKYWTTQTFDISKINIHEKLSEYMTSDFDPSSIFLHSRIIRNNSDKSIESQIQNVKSSLISQGSIVSKSDIKYLAKSLFHPFLEDVKIYKKISSNKNISEGLSQSIQIDIKLNKDKIKSIEKAKSILKEFNLIIEKKSIMMFPLNANIYFNN